MFAGKKSAQIREILISESAWEEMTCLFAPSLILSEMDIGLFSLSARHSSHNFPGKLLGYMVQSLPILGSVNAGNDLLDIVNQNNAGLIHINGEDDKLYHSALLLLQDINVRRKLGMGSNTLLKEQFSVESAAQTIEMRLEACNAIN